MKVKFRSKFFSSKGFRYRAGRWYDVPENFFGVDDKGNPKKPPKGVEVDNSPPAPPPVATDEEVEKVAPEVAGIGETAEKLDTVLKARPMKKG